MGQEARRDESNDERNESDRRDPETYVCPIAGGSPPDARADDRKHRNQRDI
jgi:hypothetical protein